MSIAGYIPRMDYKTHQLFVHVNIQTVDRSSDVLIKYFFPPSILFLRISPYALQVSTKVQIHFYCQVLLAAWLSQ